VRQRRAYYRKREKSL